MKKVNESRQRGEHGKHGRSGRIALIAATAAVLFCGTAFAYASELFGFAEIFGEKQALVAEDVVSFDEENETQLTQPSYTPEEQSMIEEGTMTVPEQAELSEDTYSASTDDYCFIDYFTGKGLHLQ